MNKKSILFSVLSLLCVSTVAGCGSDPTYKIEAQAFSNEHGLVEGGGTYKEGATVTLKIHPNIGCEVKELIFTKEGLDSTVLENNKIINPSISSDRNYHYHEFVVNSETVGKYIASFDCNQNSPSQLENVYSAKSRVKYFLYNDRDLLMDTVLIDNSSNTETDSNNVRLNNNEQFVSFGGKINPIRYHKDVEGRIKWYEDGNFQNEYDFSKPVGQSIISLYGKVEGWQTQVKDENDELTEETVKDLTLKEAIKNLKNSSRFIVNSSNNGVIEEAIVTGLNKNDDNKLGISVRDITDQSNPKQKFVLDNGNFYEYMDVDGSLKPSKFKIGDNTYKLQDIYEAYKFVKIKDIEIDNNSILQQLEDGNLEFYLPDNGLKIYVNNGLIYKIIDENDITYDINYSEGASTSPSNAADKYFVKFYSNNSQLKEELSKINNNFDKAIDVIPTYGVILDDYLENTESDLYKVLRKYYYTLNDGFNTTTKTCVSGNPYNKNIFVSNHMNICVDIKAEYKDVGNAIEKLHKGSFKITSKSIVFGKEYSEFFEVEAGTNLFDDRAEQPELMNEKIWEVISKLKTLEDDYYKFEYNSGEYKFYKNRNDGISYLTIKLNEGKITEIKYYDGLNTYVNEIEYVESKAISIIEKIEIFGEGNFVLNGNILVENPTEAEMFVENYYDLVFEDDKPLYIKQDVWEFFKVMNLLKSASQYTFDETENKYELSDGITIQFILQGEVISEVIYTPINGESVTYIIDKSEKVELFKKIINIGLGGFILDDLIKVEDYSTYYDLNFEGEKPSYIDQNTWDFYKLLQELRFNYGEYEFDKDEYTFTKNGNVYKFEFIDSLGIVKLTYTPYEDDSFVYVMDYAKYAAVVESRNNFWRFSDAIYFVSEEGELIPVSINLMNNPTLEKPSEISEDMWNVLTSIEAVLPNFSEYEYSVSGKNYTFAKDENVYVFEITEIGINEKIIKSVTINDEKYEFNLDYTIFIGVLNELINVYESADPSLGYMEMVIKIGEENELRIEFDEDSFESKLTDETNAVVRFIKKLYDIKNNSNNYEISEDSSKIIVRDINEQIVMKVLKSTLSATMTYYENNEIVGDFYLEIIIDGSYQ